MAMRLPEVACEQEVVSAVGLPDDVEYVAEEWNGADKNSDADVGGHADKSDVWDAANPSGDGDDEREESGKNIAKAGYQTDDAVDAEPEVGSGDAEAFVEEDFQGLEGGIAKEPRTAIPTVTALNNAR